MKIDLHTHSTVSDGTDSPSQLVAKAQQAGLDMIALTDHDTLAGLVDAVDTGRRLGVHVINGVEVTTEYDGVTVHLLGYGIDPHLGELSHELSVSRAARQQRVPKILARLAEAGVELDISEITGVDSGVDSAVGRPHIADALVAKGLASDRTDAFTKYLAHGCPGYVPSRRIPIGRAIQLIHGSGGAAVIAHPGIRQSVLTGDVLADLTTTYGLDGIEVDYPLHDAEQRDLYQRIGERLGLVRTGSSDYHGTGKTAHELGCNLTRPSAWELLSRIIQANGGAVPR